MQLYAISTEIEQIEKKMMAYAEENDGDVTEFPLNDELEKLGMDKEVKALSIGLHIQNMVAEALMIKAEKAKLAARQSSMENKAERWTNYLSTYLETGETYKNATTEIKWTKSEKVQVHEDIDFNDVPDTFYKTEKKFIKAEIKKGIKSGDVTWASLIATQTLKVK